MNALATLAHRARLALPGIRALFARIKRDKRLQADLDDCVHALHHEVFAQTDCLACANCCRTTSPAFYERDIDRLARALRLRPADFIARYLRRDDDGDWVLQSAPCPFLGADNYCSVYEHRPTACREYPHTDRKRFVQILDLTARNISICPATLEIVQRLQQQLDHSAKR